MTNDESLGSVPPRTKGRSKKTRLRLGLATGFGVMTLAAFGLGATVYAKTNVIQLEMESAERVLLTLRSDMERDDAAAAAASARALVAHTTAARESASGIAWNAAEVVPGLGTNFQAVRQITTTADDVARLGVFPLTEVFQDVDWNGLVPGEAFNLDPISGAEPKLSSAAHAVRMSASRLSAVDTHGLLTEVSGPLTDFQRQLKDASSTLDAAADASQIAPSMLGSKAPRTYLLMVQNNAESRASGGIPGALAVLSIDKGKLTLGSQSTAAEMGVMAPNVPVDPEQTQIYSGRLGKFMQDVNLTPDFPTAAASAKTIWERRTGQHVDGVISLDPVALSFILRATGPIQITDPGLLPIAALGLPTELSANNVVQTLLSDVYAKVEQPKLQDAYFAGVAQQTFAALSDGSSDARSLIAAITNGVEEGRVLVWSGFPDEQRVLAKYTLGGSISGPSISPARFGVYFNDGTGAKMDYYVRRTVQLIKECPRDGYEETTVRITSTNTAPGDAAASLPPYVTGDGIFGVAPGSVQTNIVAYGPPQAHVETAKLDGQKTEFAPYFHGNRPVGVLAIRLAPGESRTIDFTFGKIVQHTEPNVVVTPTVQNVKDVTLPTVNATCS